MDSTLFTISTIQFYWLIRILYLVDLTTTKFWYRCQGIEVNNYFYFMIRTNRGKALFYDPKIEKTAKSLRKQTRKRRQMHQDSNSSAAIELEQMEQECILKELAARPTNQ